MRSKKLGIGLLLISFLGACTAGTQATSTQPNPATQPPQQVAEPDAAAIVAEYKAKYVKVTAEKVQSGPHMGMVDIYLDPAHSGGYKTVGASAPDGMTVVKERLKADGSLDAAYIMKKVKGYDPANNDWFYAMTEGTTVKDKGKIGMCIQCHAGWKSTDYLAAPKEFANKLL